MKLDYMFTDHMVLQRRKPIRIYGIGDGYVTATLGDASARTLSRGGKWVVELPPMEAGGPYELTVSDSVMSVTLTDILIGDVWIASGQSNMEQPTFATENGFDAAANGKNDNIRFFTVSRRTAPGIEKYGWHFEAVWSADTPWERCTEESILHFSGIGFYFAQKLQREQGVPVGIISCNFGSTPAEAWMDEGRIDPNGELKYLLDNMANSLSSTDPDEYERVYAEHEDRFNQLCTTLDAVQQTRELGAAKFARTLSIPKPPEPPLGYRSYRWPGVLFHNMVERIAPLAVKGVLWYQGESNSSAADTYGAVFKVMVESWRALWGEQLPFFQVELAKFKGLAQQFDTIRAQQKLATETISEVYMVSAYDIGEDDNIHPIKKHIVGERLYDCVTENGYV